MAEVVPFEALRFDSTLCPDIAQVLAPPYDVISEGERTRLETQDPHNIVHLDLPRGEGDARYEQARLEMARWIGEGILRQDDQPAIYRYAQRFPNASSPTGMRERKGFVALLRLSPASEGIVLPHERTLAGPKRDREKLIRATRALFSPVFMLYRDPAGVTETAFAGIDAADPDVDATTLDGCRHRLWAVSDVEVIDVVTAFLQPRQVMIADGHHRYETLLGLRDELRPPGTPDGQSLADWAMVYFTRAEDAGLVILPTHRLFSHVPAESVASLPTRAAPWFVVREGAEATADALEERLRREGGARVTFALRQPDRSATLWFSLRPEVDLSALGPPVLRGLDVTVLHGLLLQPLLGLGAVALEQQSSLVYTPDTQVALSTLARGEAQGAFFLNATRVEQVLAACEAGFALPQKSTYFQPKLASGLVMSLIEPARAPDRSALTA